LLYRGLVIAIANPDPDVSTHPSCV
jgi:hypothetical protein